MKSQIIHLAFCGFMGAGKSTIAALTAIELSLPLFNSDKEIEARLGLNINEIFCRYGEEKFRIAEAEELKKALNTQAPQVIDLGGGAPVVPHNFALLKEKAHIIYLAAPLETCLRRLARSNDRPLLKQDIKNIQKLYSERAFCYESLADITLDASRPKVELVRQACEYYINL